MDGLVGWDWDGLDLCVGLLYEHRFAVLKIYASYIYMFGLSGTSSQAVFVSPI